MNDQGGNEPAFPIRGGLHEYQFSGASLRDYFAARASEIDVTEHLGTWNGDKTIRTREEAKFAYADAMLAARLS